MLVKIKQQIQFGINISDRDGLFTILCTQNLIADLLIVIYQSPMKFAVHTNSACCKNGERITGLCLMTAVLDGIKVTWADTLSVSRGKPRLKIDSKAFCSLLIFEISIFQELGVVMKFLISPFLCNYIVSVPSSITRKNGSPQRIIRDVTVRTIQLVVVSRKKRNVVGVRCTI